MSRALVIGGTGFIGVPTVHRLLARDHQVLVVHRGQHATVFPAGVQTAIGDRDDLAFLQQTARSFLPDVALDFISYTGQQSQKVVDALSGHCGRLVTLSSADVYRNYDGLRHRGHAPPDQLPLTEDSPVRDTLYPYRDSTDDGPPWIRDYEKLLVEKVVLGARGIAGTVVRLCKVYGPRDGQQHLGAYLERILESDGQVLVERGQAAWRWTRAYVEDVAEAIAVVAGNESSAGRVYNLGDPDALTESELLENVGRALGRDVSVGEALPEHLPERHRMHLDWRYGLEVSTQRVRRELGYTELVGRSEGIQRTVAHLMKEQNAN